MTLKNTDTHFLVVLVLLVLVAASCERDSSSSEGQNAPSATGAKSPAALAARPGEYRMSSRGLERIREHEAFVSKTYDDGVGNKTIGYGHMLRPGESLADEISEAQARELFAKDVARIVNPALGRINARLTQNQIDALGSFIYNVGPGNFTRSVLPELNAGDHKAVIAAMREYVKGRNQRTGERVALRGLIRRRGEEVALYSAPAGSVSLSLPTPDWSRVAHRLFAKGRQTLRVVGFRCSFDRCRQSRSFS